MIRQQPYDKTLDYYSLGILLYEFLFGVPPFYTSDFEELKSLILHKEITFPQNRLSKSAKNLILQLTDKDKSKRLGFSQGFIEIISHPWFSNINIESIRRKSIKAPLLPNIYEKNFDNEFSKKNFKTIDEVCSEKEDEKFGLFDKFANFSFSIDNKEQRFSVNFNKDISEEYEIMSIPGKTHSEKLPYKNAPKGKVKIFNEEFQKELQFLNKNERKSAIFQKKSIFEEDIKPDKSPIVQKIPKYHAHVGDVLKKDEMPFIDNDLSSIPSMTFIERQKSNSFFKKDFEEIDDVNDDEELKTINNQLFRNLVIKKQSMEAKEEMESSYHTAIDEKMEENDLKPSRIRKFMKHFGI